MYKVYDVQGNHVLVHHLIDVREYITKLGYTRYEEVQDDSSNSPVSDKLVYKSCMKKTYFNAEEFSKFSLCKCYSTKTQKAPTRFSDFLTVIGTSCTVKDDMAKYGVHGDVAVINDSAFYYKSYTHFVSAHGKIIPIVEQYRKNFRQYEDNMFQTHTCVPEDAGFIEADQNNAGYLWKIRPTFRSSGILAILVGIALGYKAILVHGINLDKRNHFYDLCESGVLHQWDKLYNLIDNDVYRNLFAENNIKVSSGRLSDLVGKPTKKWLNANT